MAGTSLYRAYDPDGELLYVGIGFSWAKRIKSHESKDWHQLVKTVSVQHFDDRPSDVRAKREAIRSERPAFNVQHNRPKPAPNTSMEAKDRAEAFWYVGNAHVYLRGISDGRISLEDLPNWYQPAHYILAYPKRLARFTQLWSEGRIPDGDMSHAEIIDEMNHADPAAPRIKSTGSYGNWKAKGFPGFVRPEKRGLE